MKDSNGQVVLRQNENDVTQVNADISKSTKVGSGKYTFRIDDGYGDGICCKQGNGKIEIYANNQMVASHNGQYSTSAQFGFTVPSGGGGGGGGGGSVAVKYKIDVAYDLYPEEFSVS